MTDSRILDGMQLEHVLQTTLPRMKTYREVLAVQPMGVARAFAVAMLKLLIHIKTGNPHSKFFFYDLGVRVRVARAEQKKLQSEKLRQTPEVLGLLDQLLEQFELMANQELDKTLHKPMADMFTPVVIEHVELAVAKLEILMKAKEKQN